MEVTTEEKSIKDMTLEEIKAYTASKEKQERRVRENKKKVYENGRDHAITSLINAAKYLSTQLESFKKQCHQTMDDQQDKLNEYGMIRSNSKGGFQIAHSNGEMKVVRRRDTEPIWDERAEKGVELIKDFLHDTVKKRDKKLFEILLSFIEKNQKGDLEYSKVLGLIQHRDKFEDSRWTEGLRLIQESYSNHLKAYGYEFKIKDINGKFVNIDLSFSRL